MTLWWRYSRGQWWRLMRENGTSDFSPLCVFKFILRLPAYGDDSHTGCIYLIFSDAWWRYGDAIAGGNGGALWGKTGPRRNLDEQTSSSEDEYWLPGNSVFVPFPRKQMWKGRTLRHLRQMSKRMESCRKNWQLPNFPLTPTCWRGPFRCLVPKNTSSLFFWNWTSWFGCQKTVGSVAPWFMTKCFEFQIH